MNFKTGDVVRVTNETRWGRFEGKQGVVYCDICPHAEEVADVIIEIPHVYVIFTSDHEEQAQHLLSLDEREQHYARDDAYLAGEHAFIEVSCLELVKHGTARKRRGKHHRMRVHL